MIGPRYCCGVSNVLAMLRAVAGKTVTPAATVFRIYTSRRDTSRKKPQRVVVGWTKEIPVMKRMMIPVVLGLLVALVAWLLPHSRESVAPANAGTDGSGEELSTHMARMQRQAHKLGLAIAAGNHDLAEFYGEEMDETAEQIEERFTEPLDGYKIDMLVKSLLEPQLEALEEALEGSDPSSWPAAYEGVLTACNSCHEATNHPYLRIAPSDRNPFAQDFSR
jgi:hypothetical protein